MIKVLGMPLDGVLWYCASGRSLFLGSLVLIMAVAASLFSSKKWHNIPLYYVTIISVLLIGMSAVPFSSFFYIVWTLAIAAWLTCLVLRIQTRSKVTISVCLLPAAIGLLAMFMELPHHVMPTIPSRVYTRLYVIGDSISAGIGPTGERTWPRIIAEKGFEVVDTSIAGATASSALRRQIQQTTTYDGIVLL